MMNEKKSYKVHIFDDQYLLLTDGSEALVKKAADMVDSVMREIGGNSMSLDPKKVAILAALRMADVLLAHEQSATAQEQKILSLIDYVNQALSLAHM